MGKDLNEGKFEKKYLMIDKFSKVTYIKDQRKFLESDLYIGSEGVYYIIVIIISLISVHLIESVFYLSREEK